MIESTLIKKAKLYIPQKGLLEGDIFIKDGKIIEIGPSLNHSAEQVLEEPNLALLPGVIDPHVHFRDPGVTHKEDLETGSKAAASGGVTSFFEMPNTVPSTLDRQTMADKKAIAASKSLVNYNFFIGATAENLTELNEVENVAGIKIFVGSSTGNLLVDGQEDLERIFKNGTRTIAVHSEDERMVQEGKDSCAGSSNVHDHYQRIRTPEAAIKSTKRLVSIAQHYNRRLHICHLTTQEEADYLAGVITPLKPGNPNQTPSTITTEVTPQHLMLTAPECYDELGTYAQINPPLRESRHARALWEALQAGTIGCIGTDHAPHLKEEKDNPFPKAPSGMPGIESSLKIFLHLMNQNRCTLEQVVHWMCEAPALLYQIPQKGFLIEGYDADLVLVDLEKPTTLTNDTVVSKCGWTPYQNWTLKGSPVATFVNGNLVYREGDFFSEIKGKEITVLNGA